MTPDEFSREELIRELREANERLVLAGVRERELAEEREDLLERAEEANRAKDAFLAVISHELRTPLNAITGYTELMLDPKLGGPLTDKQNDRLKRIRASTKRLLGLVEEVLTYSRLEADRAGVRTEQVDLPMLIRDVAGATEALFTAKDIDFQVHLPEEPISIATDPAKIHRILLNLLSNAAAFTDHGRVDLAGRVENGCAVFQVRDTGVGIPSDELETIFEPFHQVDATLTRSTDGTGLGLTVARRLAGLLGGDLGVESQPGRGSTFTLRLPTRVAAEAR